MRAPRTVGLCITRVAFGIRGDRLFDVAMDNPFLSTFSARSVMTIRSAVSAVWLWKLGCMPTSSSRNPVATKLRTWWSVRRSWPSALLDRCSPRSSVPGPARVSASRRAIVRAANGRSETPRKATTRTNPAPARHEGSADAFDASCIVKSDRPRPTRMPSFVFVVYVSSSILLSPTAIFLKLGGDLGRIRLISQRPKSSNERMTRRPIVFQALFFPSRVTLQWVGGAEVRCTFTCEFPTPPLVLAHRWRLGAHGSPALARQ